VLPRPYDFIAALISLAHIARAAGYRGLLITFDEWEVQAQSMTKKQEERILALLQALNYFFCDSSVPKAFISFYIFDVTKSQPNEDDLLIEQLRQETKGAHYRVKIIKDWDSNNRELSSMVSRINQAYCRCYDAVSLPDSEIMSKIEDSLGNVNYHESGAMRRTIKLIISVMDSIYGPPQSQSQ
jgi:uncharacterized protein (DUF58 family)